MPAAAQQMWREIVADYFANAPVYIPETARASARLIMPRIPS